MATIIFTFNSKQITIQCKKEDLMKDICQKFASNINKEIDELLFLYEGEKIHYELTFNEQAKEYDNKNGKMNILVYLFEDNEYKKSIKSKDIICPKCGEICLLNIKDYIISFYDCKNEDILNNISLNEYETIQKKEKSKIICTDCKKIFLIMNVLSAYYVK